MSQQLVILMPFNNRKLSSVQLYSKQVNLSKIGAT